MDLLPKFHTEFNSQEYWDKFFKRLGSKTFEWYGEYPQLCGVLHKYIKLSDKILVVGCGNSQLSADMYDIGITNIINIDVSDVVIRQMTDKNRTRSKMFFVKMDVTKMPCEDGEFSVVFDKGTLDALMINSEMEVLANIDKMFSEIMRVLKLGGRYICISLLQDHILKKLLFDFSKSCWPIRIHRINTENASDFQLPVFAVVLTKFKKMEGMKQILEISSFEDKIERVETVDNLIKVVKEMQYYGILRGQIANNSMMGHQPSLSLYDELISAPRYKLYIVDNSKPCVNKFAIFIAPEGRETDWLFSTENGRQQLSVSAGFQRLVIATLDRNHTYERLDSIQSELSGKVMELAPPSYRPGVKVPFLSLGGDIGKRTVRKRYRSDTSGDYLVEDVVGDNGHIFRRLIFLSNQNLVQSEVQLIIGDQRKKKPKSKTMSVDLVIDKSYLACQHHLAMIGGLAFLPSAKFTSETNVSCLIIGLGGGALPLFIHQHIPYVNIDTVDIDATMVDIAKEWFDFKTNKSLTVHVANGLDFVKNISAEGKMYDIVMFDVDSKDSTLGLSCPPTIFLEKIFLQTVSTIITPQGVFVLNLVCRDEDLKKQLLERVKTVFKDVYSVVIDNEVNDIIFGQKQHNEDVDIDNFVKNVKQNAKSLNDYIKKNSQMDLVEAISNLKIG